PELDDPLERRAVDRAVIRGEALAQPVRPIFACDWSQAVKSTEAAEGPMAGREQVTHHVLEAPGEQIADARAPLEYRSHPLGDGIWVAVRTPLAGHLLKLIEEQDQPFAIGGGHPLRKAQREVERPLRVLGGEAWSDCNLDRVVKLPLELEDRCA